MSGRAGCRRPENPGLSMPAKPRRRSAQTADAPRCAAASVSATAAAAENEAEREANAAPTAAAPADSATNSSTATTKTTTTTTTTVASATTMAAAAAAAARQLHEAGGAVLPVEEVECRQTDVGHFLFAEHEAVIGRGVQSLRNIGGRKSGRRCASHERKAEPGGAECGQGSDLGPTLFLRSLLHPGHITSSTPVFSFQPKKSYVGPTRRASWNEFTSSLDDQFPFLLIDGAPLVHDHERLKASAQGQEALRA